jgi:magnesium transporter
VVGAFPPGHTVGETIERLRELVKTAFITYIYVTDAEHRLLGVVTMREMLLSARERRLDEIMIKDVFALSASTPLQDAMKRVLDRHYPVYPVIDHDHRLIGLVRGQAMFEAQAIEITLQAGSMVGVEKEERLATHWVHA